MFTEGNFYSPISYNGQSSDISKETPGVILSFSYNNNTGEVRDDTPPDPGCGIVTIGVALKSDINYSNITINTYSLYTTLQNFAWFFSPNNGYFTSCGVYNEGLPGGAQNSVTTYKKCPSSLNFNSTQKTLTLYDKNNINIGIITFS
jgi:hypothetical protein